MMENSSEQALKRVIGLPLLTLYGLGVTIGGGIYVLIGKVAGRAGLYAPLSFLLAAALVAFTAFTFCELAARYPKSAGEAVYVREGFGRRHLAMLVGLLVVFNGIVSSAALANGFVGHVLELWAMPGWAIGIATMVAIGCLAAWGIGESVAAAAFITVIEIGGLLVIIFFGADSLAALPERWHEFVPAMEAPVWIGIFAGSFLAFYAFIGFEDMVNIAEEVKDVTRTMPRAILLSLAVTTAIYLAVALIAVSAVAPSRLAESGAPLVMIFEETSGRSPALLNVIAMLAVLNGLLIQVIMATRVLYGMGQAGWLPASVSAVHPKTRTPVRATVLVTLVIIALSLSYSVELLAEVTSFIVLLISVLVNGALIRLKRKGPAPEGIRAVPFWVPVMGLLVSAAFCVLIVANRIWG